ncbi:MAG: hypothetical protein ABIE74_09670 [Pseudomonadota bacterium]
MSEISFRTALRETGNWLSGPILPSYESASLYSGLSSFGVLGTSYSGLIHNYNKLLGAPSFTSASSRFMNRSPVTSGGWGSMFVNSVISGIKFGNFDKLKEHTSSLIGAFGAPLGYLIAHGNGSRNKSTNYKVQKNNRANPPTTQQTRPRRNGGPASNSTTNPSKQNAASRQAASTSTRALNNAPPRVSLADLRSAENVYQDIFERRLSAFETNSDTVELQKEYKKAYDEYNSLLGSGNKNDLSEKDKKIKIAFAANKAKLKRRLPKYLMDAIQEHKRAAARAKQVLNAKTTPMPVQPSKPATPPAPTASQKNSEEKKRMGTSKNLI